MLCRTALRRSASYGGHPSPAPFHCAYFCKQKKIYGQQDDLPFVTLAKDGGGSKEISDNSPQLKIGKVFQEYCLRKFNEIFSKFLRQAEKIRGVVSYFVIRFAQIQHN